MKTSIISVLLILGLGGLSIPFALSDDDSSDRYSFFKWERKKSKGIDNPINPLYQEECGSCHMAYQPGLLPAKSWGTILSNLDHHFGDNAEMDNEDLQIIRQYLESHAADKSDYRRSRKFARMDNSVKIIDRITQTPYFRHEHHEIPLRMVKNNEKVRSFSHCNTCHLGAEKGFYDEHDVRIPGYGYWDD